MSGLEHRQPLAGAPERMRDSLGHEPLGHERQERVRARERRTAPVGEPTPALLRRARDPFVAREATHAVPGADVGYREAVTEGVLHEFQPFDHGVRLQPGHRDLAQ